MKSVAERVKADPRITRRRASVERARLRRFQWRAGAVILAALVLWLALWSPLFKFREVEVTGGHHISEKEVIEVAGLDSGDNILMLSQERIKEAVEALPWVRSARIERRLPGTIRVVINERNPAMIFTTAAGRWTIDRSGRVLSKGDRYGGLPSIATDSAPDLAPGDQVDTPQVRAAVSAVGSMPSDLRRRVKAVFAASSERITFSLHRGPDVRYGAAERLHDKNAVLQAVLDRLHATGESPAYIDVRVPESPAVGNG
jgi:cell division protein FtsQ